MASNFPKRPVVTGSEEGIIVTLYDVMTGHRDCTAVLEPLEALQMAHRLIDEGLRGMYAAQRYDPGSRPPPPQPVDALRPRPAAAGASTAPAVISAALPGGLSSIGER